jgi:hypothetical protein
MASVDLAYTWVNLLSTGESVKGYTARGRSHDRAGDGETRRMAGGRFRAIGTLGTRRSQQFAIRDLSLADVDTLESWIGQTVVIRDNRGRRMFGVYWSVPTSDRMDPNYYDVALSVTEVTYEEGTL